MHHSEHQQYHAHLVLHLRPKRSDMSGKRQGDLIKLFGTVNPVEVSGSLHRPLRPPFA